MPADAVLGELGKGFYHISWELQSERMVAAAGCVAGAERMFDKTLEYAKEREAFGRPIGKFQVIRHKFAEMATKIEAAQRMVYVTAWRVAERRVPPRHRAKPTKGSGQPASQRTGGIQYLPHHGR